MIDTEWEEKRESLGADLENKIRMLPPTIPKVKISFPYSNSSEEVEVDRWNLMCRCEQWAQVDGICCEFGIWNGKSLAEICKLFGGTVLGFDSFQGWPEPLKIGSKILSTNYFKTKVPNVPGAEIIVGWFADTVAKTLQSYSRPIRFAHIDSDLYSSAVTALSAMKPYIVPGTILLFGQLMAFKNYPNYTNWRDHEWRALLESDLDVEPLGHTNHCEVALRVNLP